MHVRAGCTMALAVLLAAPGVLAEPSRGGVELTVPVLAGQEDAFSVAVNPGQMALLRGWNLAYLHFEGISSSEANRGDGLFFASPLFFGLAVGVGIEWVRPPDGRPWRSPITIALGWQYGRRLSIGVASRWIACSEDLGIDGLWAADIGVTLRLSHYVALAAVARGVNDPRPATSNPVDRVGFGREWALGLTLRPIVADYLSVAGEVSFAEQTERLTLRGALLLRPVSGWTIRADVTGWFQGPDTGLTVTVATELAFSFFTVGGGVRLAAAEGEAPEYDGFSVMATASQDGHGVVWQPRRVVEILLSDRVDTRDLAALERTLERARRDRSVRGVLIVPRGGFSASLSAVQELRWAIGRLQRSGKPVACYLEDASGTEYYLCAGADRILVNAGGGIRITGLRMTSLFLGEALDRLGVQVELVRIGEYKSTPELLTQSEPSPENRAASEAYISSVYRRYIWDLAHDRNVPTKRMQELVDDGPYVAPDAVRATLADQTVHADEVEDALVEVFGRRYFIDDRYSRSLPEQRTWTGGPAMALVHVEGSIVDGESFESGPSWLRMAGARTVCRAIEAARENRRVKAVVVRIDSPGGAVLGSDLIWREIDLTSRDKPVIASLGGVAASGGYYIASAADEIYTDPATLTGSIGIFYGKADLSGLLGKIGVRPFHYKRGRRAGYSDWTRPWTDDERAAMAQGVRHFYNRFLDRVVEGREPFTTRSQVDAVGRGRIWSGQEAVRIKLVDHIGGLDHALERARERGHLGATPEVIELPVPRRTLLERAVDYIGVQQQPGVALPPILERALETAAPLAYSEPSRPLALLPFAYEIE